MPQEHYSVINLGITNKKINTTEKGRSKGQLRPIQ